MVENVGTATTAKKRDEKLDLQNAQKIFDETIHVISEQLGGVEKLVFPKEIMWLGGAPGAGKGTNTPFINRERGLTAPPIIMSDLLDTQEMRDIKNAGHLIGDGESVLALLQELLKDQYESGVVVDGFPRTKVQAECVRLLYNKMYELRRQFFDSPIGPQFRRPIFRIIVLYVREQVSTERQLQRGRNVQAHNKKVEDSGDGILQSLRKTDLDENLAKERYEVFKRQTFDALNSLRDNFHYHFVDANRTVAEVEQSIQDDFSYQSSLELGEDTYDSIHNIPLAEELVLHTRQKMVRRLDNYRHRHSEIFARAISLIEEEVVPALKRHAAAGRAKIRLVDPLLDRKIAVDMMIDVLTERGFAVTTTCTDETHALRVDPHTHAIITATRHIWVFEIRFHAPHIRR